MGIKTILTDEKDNGKNEKVATIAFKKRDKMIKNHM